MRTGCAEDPSGRAQKVHNSAYDNREKDVSVPPSPKKAKH